MPSKISALAKAAVSSVTPASLHWRQVFYLAWPTIMGYLRIATHPGIFTAPLSPDEALENIHRGYGHARNPRDRCIDVGGFVSDGVRW